MNLQHVAAFIWGSQNTIINNILQPLWNKRTKEAGGEGLPFKVWSRKAMSATDAQHLWKSNQDVSDRAPEQTYPVLHSKSLSLGLFPESDNGQLFTAVAQLLPFDSYMEDYIEWVWVAPIPLWTWNEVLIYMHLTSSCHCPPLYPLCRESGDFSLQPRQLVYIITVEGWVPRKHRYKVWPLPRGILILQRQKEQKVILSFRLVCLQRWDL